MHFSRYVGTLTGIRHLAPARPGSPGLTKPSTNQRRPGYDVIQKWPWARAGSRRLTRKTVSPTARDKIGARIVFMQRLLGDYVIPSAVVLDSRGQPDSRSPVNRPHVNLTNEEPRNSSMLAACWKRNATEQGPVFRFHSWQ